MPVLLSRQPSTGSLSAIVEISQRFTFQTSLEYDLKLENNQLEIVLSPKNANTPKCFRETDKRNQNNINTIKRIPNMSCLPKHHPSSSDEGFESDLDSISLISCENELFTEKSTVKNNLTETDSANGGSGTDSDSENDKGNTLTQKNVALIKETFEKQIQNNVKSKESYNLADCVCYTDVAHQDILIFVIKHEALVFRFDSLLKLKSFYKKFSTLKAIANQQVYSNNKNGKEKFNLLQKTDVNGVTHIEIKKQNISENPKFFHEDVTQLSKISSIEAVKTIDENRSQYFYNNNKDSLLSVKGENFVSEGKSSSILTFKEFISSSTDLSLLNDVKFNTINNKVGQKKMLTRSSSIEDILNVENKESNLVKENFLNLRKVWNSAEDLLSLEPPKRPERRKKKKPAPQPPQQTSTLPESTEDVYSGKFVRVNVNIENSNLDQKLLVAKSTLSESHPRKIGQNNFLSNTKVNFSNFLKSSSNRSNSANNLQFSRFVPSLDIKTDNVSNFSANTLNRKPIKTNLYEKNSQWTNSVPRILKKSRSRSETRNSQNFQPMAYRYVDATLENKSQNFSTTAQNNAMFLNATGLKPKPVNNEPYQPRISYGYNVKNLPNNRPFPKTNNSNISNRVFGLSPKLRDFSKEEKLNSKKWASETNLKNVGQDFEKNLKSSIKTFENNTSTKKKNDKKVTFSAYTTVQVV